MSDPSSLLLEMWPKLGLLVSGELKADLDRLLSSLLPVARVTAARRNAHFGAVISNSGRVSFVRSGVSAAWSDRNALADRLDALVAGNKVRAVAQSAPVALRRSDGLQNWTVEAIHIRVDHRAPASYDFLVALEWGAIKRQGVPDPESTDRILHGFPHRVWPGAPSAVLSAAEAYEHYTSDGIYNELHRAIEIAEDDLRRSDDLGRSAAADRLAGYLGTRFRHSGQDIDLERAVVLAREAAERSGGDAVLHARLGRLLGLRFLQNGRLSALEEGIEEARLAHANGQTEVAEILGELLLMRYRATAEHESLAEALETLEPAARRLNTVEHVPARLSAALGDAYMRRFERSGDRSDLEMAIGALQHSVDMTPINAEVAARAGLEYPRRLRAEAVARLRLYEITREEAQLELAYRGLAVASEQTHAESPERPGLQIALAATRVYRLPDDRLIALLEGERRRTGPDESGDAPWFSFLAAHIQMLRDLDHNLPEGAPERPVALAHMATLYRDLFRRNGKVQMLYEAAWKAARAAADWSKRFPTVGVAQKLGMSEEGARLYELAVETLLEAGEHDASKHADAFVVADAAKSRLLMEQLGRGEIAAPPQVPADLLRRERALLDELSRLDAAALAARDTGVGFRPSSERRERVLAELDEVWAAINAPDYIATRRGDALDWLRLREVVLDCEPGTGVLSLFVLDDRTALFLADGSGFGVEQVPIGRRIWREALRRFQREVPGSFGQDLLAPTWEAPLRPLLEAAAEHLNGCSHLLVVPHGPAHGLPWGYLTRDWNGPPAISTVSSLAMLDRLRRRAAPRSHRSLVIGNPTGDLADAEAEAIAAAHVLGVTPLLGLAASGAALDAAAPNARMLHLACHAGFDPSSPLDSHVVLCDGPWRARDALTRRLDADLVVLSGCETGLADSLAGDELAGLAQAFLYAGARSVIVSLWRVSDAAAADLMRVFHQQRSAGAATSAALRTAADAVRREHEHPWYWAAFTLVGRS